MKNNNSQKGFILPIIIVVLIFVVAGIGYFATHNEKPLSSNISQTDTSAKMLIENTIKKEDNMHKNGTYEAYDVAKLANTATGNVVLFFHASWCPTCRALDVDIKNNLKNIPPNVTILDVDYDNSDALKQKYGVTIQHTLVQVDKDGNLIKKWSGSPTLSSVIGQIK